jgi:hypothetical protein
VLTRTLTNDRKIWQPELFQRLVLTCNVRARVAVLLLLLLRRRLNYTRKLRNFHRTPRADTRTRQTHPMSLASLAKLERMNPRVFLHGTSFDGAYTPMFDIGLYMQHMCRRLPYTLVWFKDLQFVHFISSPV